MLILNLDLRTKQWYYFFIIQIVKDEKEGNMGIEETGFLIHDYWYRLAYHFDRQSGDMCENLKHASCWTQPLYS